MADNTHISWTDATWNPFAGCSKVSQGCKNCYAIKHAHRLSGNPNMKIRKKYAGTTTSDGKNWTGKINFDEEVLNLPTKWKKPRKIFVNSMSDMFHPTVSFNWIAAVFAIMLSTECNHHTFQILTKHPDRAVEFFQWIKSCDRPENVVDLRDRRIVAEALDYYEGVFPKNIQLLTSIEDQPTADARIPYLLELPVSICGISAEPLLNKVNITTWLDAMAFSHDDGRATIYRPKLNWVIVGGESGISARPTHIEHIRAVVQQCKAASVPVFVKQLGAKLIGNYYENIDDNFRERMFDRRIRLIGWRDESDGQPPPDTEVLFRLEDAKGSDINEFPEDLRVREFPN